MKFVFGETISELQSYIKHNTLKYILGVDFEFAQEWWKKCQRGKHRLNFAMLSVLSLLKIAHNYIVNLSFCKSYCWCWEGILLFWNCNPPSKTGGG